MELSDRERAERFIEMYRRIEDKLGEKYAGRRIKYSSVIMQFINEPEGAEFSDELNTCREIRNILIHRPDVAGGPPLIPSDGTIGVLNAILDYLNAPPPAIDYATPASRILKTNFEQNVTQIMRTMNKKGFSHAPVFDEGKFYGVFSVSTIFSYILDNPGAAIDDGFRVGALKKYLPIDKHSIERFEFVPKDTNVWDVKEKLERKCSNKNKRLAAVFVTENGVIDEELLGIITPWDVVLINR